MGVLAQNMQTAHGNESKSERINEFTCTHAHERARMHTCTHAHAHSHSYTFTRAHEHITTKATHVWI